MSVLNRRFRLTYCGKKVAENLQPGMKVFSLLCSFLHPYFFPRCSTCGQFTPEPPVLDQTRSTCDMTVKRRVYSFKKVCGPLGQQCVACLPPYLTRVECTCSGGMYSGVPRNRAADDVAELPDFFLSEERLHLITPNKLLCTPARTKLK
jgi:hypothetical protein